MRDAVAASQRGAAELVPDLPAERVGLVASVAACCATYAAVLRMSGGNVRLDDVAVGALQDVLGTEHAALWSYALASRSCSRTQVATARDGRRGAPRAARPDRGDADPARAAPGVRPARVRDPAARRRTRRPRPGCWSTAETDAAAAWRSVLERSTDRALRRAGLRALTDTAVRCARWRGVVGTRPAVPVFPGRP